MLIFPASPSSDSIRYAALSWPFASVDDYKVGQWCVFVFKPFVTAVHDFLHGSEIVRAFHRFDDEMPVILFSTVFRS